MNADKNENGIRWSVVLCVGLLAFVLPTMFDVAIKSWSTEQGAHGPIVLLTGIWLLVRDLRRSPVATSAAYSSLALILIGPLLIMFVLARVSGIIEIESFLMYVILIVAAYATWGAAVLKRVWFPLIYLLFIFPPPDTLFAIITQPMKIFISQSAVEILHLAGYPVAGSGVTIQIGQYQMLVAAACAGLNSLLSLTALGLFYTYLRHSSQWRYMLWLVACIVPIAIFANLIRVLLLLLITYHFGEAAGQGFFHDAAGLVMFGSALLSIFLLDWWGRSFLERFYPSSAVS